MESILNDFYSVKKIKATDSGEQIEISLNKNHDIFKGHFPNNPVTPGVCMMQIVKDLSEKHIGRRLILSSASNVKFMAIINPEINPDLILSLEFSEDDDFLKVKNTTTFGETIALKMSLTYKNL